MKYSTGLWGFGAALAGTLAFVGCGSSGNNGSPVYFGGSGGTGGAGASPGGAQSGGAGGSIGGSTGLAGSAALGGAGAVAGGSAGSGGDPSGAGVAGVGTGGMSGSAGNNVAGAGMGGGSAGGGGAPIAINSAIVLLDTILLRPKTTGGTGGTGGASGTGAAGAAGATAGAGGGVGAAGGAGAGAGAGGASSAGSGGATGSAGTSGGAGGGAGAPSVIDHSRSYTFDMDRQMWALHAEGSTPNIGSAGGMEKLSAQTTLTFNASDGVPKLGSLQLSIPFSHTGEQLDVNQYFAAAGVSAEEDWTGYELIAKVKLALGGDLGTCLGSWIYATSEGFIFARSPELLLKPADGWVDMRFDLDAPDSGVGQTVVPPSTAGFDKTKINQFGIMIESYHCP